LEGIQQALAGDIEFPNFELPESIFKNIFVISRKDLQMLTGWAVENPSLWGLECDLNKAR